MLSIVIHVHSPSLFSTVLSFFYTAPHAPVRLALMKCVGEISRCWSAELLSAKQPEMINLILTGLKDRRGDVRDASRIVFCVLYYRQLDQNPSLRSPTELDSQQGEPRYDLREQRRHASPSFSLPSSVLPSAPPLSSFSAATSNSTTR